MKKVHALLPSYLSYNNALYHLQANKGEACCDIQFTLTQRPHFLILLSSLLFPLCLTLDISQPPLTRREGTR
jgi:hypothetical protein